jgi:5-formyltetrahydrofolate cyclo-ligase
MNSEIALQKRGLRSELRAQRNLPSGVDRTQASLRACEMLRLQSIWQRATSVLFYAALQDELDVSPLLEEALAGGKTVSLPRFIHETGCYAAFTIRHATQDCVSGKFGIAEPSERCPAFPLNRLDLVLTPGVAFDLAGHRLGRGQGFYDRLLAQASGIKCGVAYDEQIVRQIPAEPHDVHVNCILTPSRWLEISG